MPLFKEKRDRLIALINEIHFHFLSAKRVFCIYLQMIF
ncbi:hypothetical protein CHCC5027_0944 [Bacillus paralicheniformis]|nr:hypothetical protein CHCC5027_0944 [Bacillus paralicheniformis]